MHTIVLRLLPCLDHRRFGFSETVIYACGAVVSCTAYQYQDSLTYLRENPNICKTPGPKCFEESSKCNKLSRIRTVAKAAYLE